MISVTLPNIRDAAERIAGEALRTPLVRLPLPGEVYAKAENLQRTNSFKFRGAYNFLASLDGTALARGVVTHSSGNHAQGVALAAKLLGVPATIVIPEGAPALKVDRTRGHGAEIIRCGNSSDDRERVAAELVESRGLTLVPPFDHELIVAGQGTVGLEIIDELPQVANVIVPVGGGGLSAGVAVAVTEVRPDTRVIGVEPELAADAAESLARGVPVRWDAERVGRTVADGVRTQRLGSVNFPILAERLAGMVTVSEEEILAATRWYALEGRLVVEPTGALSLAALHKLGRGGADPGLRPGPSVVVISGGNVDPAFLSRLLVD